MPTGPPGWVPAPGATPPPAGRSGLALASMVVGIVGLLACFTVVPSVVALVLGVVALRQIARSAGARSGRGMAVAGVVLGALGVVVGAVLVAVAIREFSSTTSIYDLEAGDCIELPDLDADEVSRVEEFDCDESHGAEVFATGDLGRGSDPYPTDAEGQAFVRCLEAFEPYVGSSLQDTELELVHVYPSEAVWEDDQSFVCIAYLPGGELVGSVRGSGR